MQSLKQFDDIVPRTDNKFDFDSHYWQNWLTSEGFKHITEHTEDSYQFLEKYPDDKYNSFIRNNYWYWSRLVRCYIIRIYVFRTCVIVDKDWDCGGNCGGMSFDFDEYSIEEIWDEIIEYIKLNLEEV